MRPPAALPRPRRRRGRGPWPGPARGPARGPRRGPQARQRAGGGGGEGPRHHGRRQQGHAVRRVGRAPAAAGGQRNVDQPRRGRGPEGEGPQGRSAAGCARGRAASDPAAVGRCLPRGGRGGAQEHLCRAAAGVSGEQRRRHDLDQPVPAADRRAHVRPDHGAAGGGRAGLVRPRRRRSAGPPGATSETIAPQSRSRPRPRAINGSTVCA